MGYQTDSMDTVKISKYDTICYKLVSRNQEYYKVIEL
ncbi:MAG: hypothetical protein PEPC_01375 [Peptostreptococcus russellii]